VKILADYEVNLPCFFQLSYIEFVLPALMIMKDVGWPLRRVAIFHHKIVKPHRSLISAKILMQKILLEKL
jgi:hypothetical protein